MKRIEMINLEGKNKALFSLFFMHIYMNIYTYVFVLDKVYFKTSADDKKHAKIFSMCRVKNLI